MPNGDRPTGGHPDTQPELPVDPDAEPARPLLSRPTAALWVFAGGAVGTAFRQALETLLPSDGAHWPWATFLINLSGAFLLGVLLEGLVRAGDHSRLRQRIRLSCGTGGCGAFTTYSTLALEVSLLSKNAHLATAIGYGLASVVAGVVAAWLGIILAAGFHPGR
jgi:CrcB protein